MFFRFRLLLMLGGGFSMFNSGCTFGRGRSSTLPVVPNVTSAIDADIVPPIPGIPVRPDLVAVVPFHRDPGFERSGMVLIEAEVDGHRGTFILDTGSGNFQLVSDSMQRSATGRIGGQDPVPITIHNFRVGTITVPIDSIPVGSWHPPKSNAMLVSSNLKVLGNIGLDGIESFETIIDYVHQRVVFIRVDKRGRRLVEVPAYTRRGSAQLIPFPLGEEWGLPAHTQHPQNQYDTLLKVLFLDTGTTAGTDAIDPDQEQAADQLKQAIAADPNAGHAPTHVNIEYRKLMSIYDSKPMPYIFGDVFLRRLGVVGFNLRAHELILYR